MKAHWTVEPDGEWVLRAQVSEEEDDSVCAIREDGVWVAWYPGTVEVKYIGHGYATNQNAALAEAVTLITASGAWPGLEIDYEGLQGH